MSAHVRKRTALRIGFVGAGRVGTALAWHCRRAGLCIAGLADKDPAQARAAHQLLRLPFLKTPASRVAARSDVLFFTVPDGSIARAYQAARPVPGTIVCHCSGALGLDVFEGRNRAGLDALALHPVQVFTSHVQAIDSLPGSWWALDGSKRGMAFGRRLVQLLDGRAVTVAGAVRPAWHAACVFASNFQAALFDAVERIGSGPGIRQNRMLEIVAPLACTTLESILRQGSAEALTGPVQRGDSETVRAHIEALARQAPELLPMYRELSLRLVGLARSRGLTKSAERRLEKALARRQ
ncbi:DUF2520 domain-containing protein [candidate division WOR-3 bacterium]|nr:DUF2520 domain-containing protein [candidate division WOR-3 bacterium]